MGGQCRSFGLSGTHWGLVGLTSSHRGSVGLTGTIGARWS